MMAIFTCLRNTRQEDNVNTKIQSNKKPDLPEDFQFTISEIFCTVWDEHAINLTEFFYPKMKDCQFKRNPNALNIRFEETVTIRFNVYMVKKSLERLFC